MKDDSPQRSDRGLYVCAYTFMSPSNTQSVARGKGASGVQRVSSQCEMEAWQRVDFT